MTTQLQPTSIKSTAPASCNTMVRFLRFPHFCVIEKNTSSAALKVGCVNHDQLAPVVGDVLAVLIRAVWIREPSEIRKLAMMCEDLADALKKYDSAYANEYMAGFGFFRQNVIAILAGYTGVELAYNFQNSQVIYRCVGYAGGHTLGFYESTGERFLMLLGNREAK